MHRRDSPAAPTVVAHRIAMSAPDITEADIQAVVDVLRSGTLALGPRCEQFERAVAHYVGVSHAVAVSSGTAALHLIVRGLGIGHGQEVLVPSFTFAASVNALLYEGATPVFVDIEPDTYNLDPVDVERKITSKTRAIMAVDVFGHPVEWDPILDIARRHGLEIIDDSCEALGAEYRGCRLGNFGAAAAFAFYPNKQMTTGEGGMIVTSNDTLAQLARSLRNQGRGQMGAWLEHDRLGYNYRLDEMSAALGLTQFGRLDSILAKRDRVARGYTERLLGQGLVRPPAVRPHVRMSWFVYVITLPEGVQRDAVMASMEACGIPVRGYFSPIHTQPYIRNQFGLSHGPLPVTESIASRTMALPFHNGLTDLDLDIVVGALGEALLESTPAR